MAVGTQHLGKQVRCPHCRQVVTAPATAAPAAAVPAPPIPSPVVSTPPAVVNQPAPVQVTPPPAPAPQPLAPVAASQPAPAAVNKPVSVPTPTSAPVFTMPPPGPSRDEHESIFGEHIDEDDLFGGNRPKLEVPDQPPADGPPPQLEPTVFQVPGLPPTGPGTPMPSPMIGPYNSEPPSSQGPSPFASNAGAFSLGTNGAGVAHDPAPPSFTAPAPLVSAASTRTPTKNNTQLILMSVLVILVPYALFITVLSIYFYFRLQTIPDPRENLPDWGNPPASRGGPAANAGSRNTVVVERVKPDQPLPTKLVTKLGDTIRIGDLEVTPLSVEQTRITIVDFSGRDAVSGQFSTVSPKEEVLVLKLRLKNKSSDVYFRPCDPAFDYKWKEGTDANANMPYTFLEMNGKKYCNYVDRKKPRFDPVTGRPTWDPDSAVRGQEAGFKTLDPNAEITTFITTNTDDSPVRALKGPQNSQGYQGPMVWRLELRRGLVPSKGKEVSATAQIAVEFDSSQIKVPGQPAQP
jgi:hypothetical protein